MTKRTLFRGSALLLAAGSVGTFFGCANYEVNSGRGNLPGHYVRYELQEADRAVESARSAGKSQLCPAEFKQAEDAKNNAYDVFRACHTEEGAALAKQATAKVGALCPPVVVVPPPAPVPVPPPVAPTDLLSVTPASIVKGSGATLSWTSTDASACQIEPGIGSVQTVGSMGVTPQNDTSYTLVCNGAGGSASSKADVAVTLPPPPPVLCKPTVIDINFDTNKSDVKAQYHAELKKLADFLKEFPKATGTIEGHTDSVGHLAANMKLSQRRADSVRSYLIEKFGIAADRIQAKGYGPTKPLADNGTAAGRTKNRRIESHFNCN